MDTAGKKVRKRGKVKPFLPDEIIRNILIRLPVENVVRFEAVSRKWSDMILARDFVDLYQRSSIPVILVGKTCGDHLDLFAVDKWWDLSRTRSLIHRFPFDCAADFPNASLELVSHAGLIVLKSLLGGLKFTILNPVRSSDEFAEINISRKFRGDIRAVYYHPSLKEYCSLLMVANPNSIPNGDEPPYQIKVLNLGSNLSLRTVCDSFGYIVKDVDAYPLFVNDHLYWMLKSERKGKFGGYNDILEFDIITEEFKVIPCPIPLNTECKKRQTHMLNSDGVLTFLLILPSTITLWRLQDHVQQLWTATEYTISLEFCHDFKALGIIAVVDGMLALQYERRLFVCNLRCGTVKKYPKKYGGDVVFLSHQMSLASLKNCKQVCLEEDGRAYDYWLNYVEF